jgi:serine/threonine protein kinase/Flp pilus assembly protein TadD
MSDTPVDKDLLTTSLEGRGERFEQAWRSWRGGEKTPSWRDFLPAPGKPGDSEQVFYLIQVDIEFRVKAGLPALLGEKYFQDSLVREGEGRLSEDQQVELIRWEYQQRWKHGERVGRKVYLEAFPQHAQALADLKPRWNCSSCSHKGIVLEDDATEELCCPRCGKTFPITEIFRPRSSLAGSEAAAGELDLRAYELLEPLGAGGMGEVYRGRDPGLGRDLAVKVVRACYRGNPHVERRFMREARVTGSLQHPDIVPVHNLGRLPDGRLYYTMKLVRGQTMERILAEGAGGGGEQLAYLLGIFEKVCQAVGYAHSQRVIHRDLKPANIMVGSFGEVQVMDWGLAKVLSHRENQTTLAEDEGSGNAGEPKEPGGNLSQAGTAMGTLAYMPPEQAAGRLDLVDERADVFSLGAILCVLLSGQPPYYHPDREAMFLQAQRGDLKGAWERLDVSGQEAELVSICKECLALEPEKRPRDAGVVAARLGAYRAGVQERLRRAELDRETAQVKAREERRRRRVALGLAASLLVLVLSVAGAALWYQQYQAERTYRSGRLKEEVKAALEGGDREWKDLHEGLVDAQKVRWLLGDLQRWKKKLDEVQGYWQQGQKLADSDPELLGPELLEGLQSLKRNLQAGELDWRFAARLDEIRLKAATPFDGKFDPHAAAPEYGEAFQQEGWHIKESDAADIAQRLAATPIRYALVAALDDWASLTRDRELGVKLLEIARQADPDPWRNEFRQRSVWRDRAKLEKLAEKVDYARQSPQILRVLATRLELSGADSEGFLTTALLHYPSDFWLNFLIGNLLKEPTARVPYFRAAWVLRPESSMALGRLGFSLAEAGNVPGGIEHCQKAIHLNPQQPELHGLLGYTLIMKEDWAGAVESFQKALQLKPDLAEAHYALGVVRFKKDDVPGAIENFQKALALEPNLGEAHSALGNALYKQGDLSAAIMHYQKSLEFRPNESEVWNFLSALYRQQGKIAEAQHAMQRGKELEVLNNKETLHVVDMKTLHEGVQGKLTKNLPLDLAGPFNQSYRKVHAVRLEGGKFYQIDLAGDFDTLLRVEDAGYHGLIFNDDASPPEVLDSRLIFGPVKNGIYHLVVTSYRPGTTGRYTLKIREVMPKGELNIIQGELKETKDRFHDKFLMRHVVALTGGRPCVVELQSQYFDGYLLVVEPTGQKAIVENAWGNNKVVRIDFTPTLTANYIIGVTSQQPREMGAYTVTVQEYGPLEGETKK